MRNLIVFLLDRPRAFLEIRICNIENRFRPRVDGFGREATVMGSLTTHYCSLLGVAKQPPVSLTILCCRFCIINGDSMFRGGTVMPRARQRFAKNPKTWAPSFETVVH